MKGIANCTCGKCGKSFTREIFVSGHFNKNKEYLDKKVEWAENGGFNRCSDCYKADIEERKMNEAMKESEIKLFPIEPISSTVVSVHIKENEVQIESKYDKKVVDALRKLSCSWNSKLSRWEKPYCEEITDGKDAAAEVVNGLLNANIIVECENAEVRDKAVKADYIPTPTRIITASKDNDNTLEIKWGERDERIYSDARAIQGSKWESPSVIVNVKKYDDIEGFAERYGFYITESAQERLRLARESRLRATVTPAAHKEFEHHEFSGKAILESEAKVMDKHIIN